MSEPVLLIDVLIPAYNAGRTTRSALSYAGIWVTP